MQIASLHDLAGSPRSSCTHAQHVVNYTDSLVWTGKKLMHLWRRRQDAHTQYAETKRAHRGLLALITHRGRLALFRGGRASRGELGRARDDRPAPDLDALLDDLLARDGRDADVDRVRAEPAARAVSECGRGREGGACMYLVYVKKL
jgi:hypothetical protein